MTIPIFYYNHGNGNYISIRNIVSLYLTLTYKVYHITITYQTKKIAKYQSLFILRHILQDNIPIFLDIEAGIGR